MHFPVKASHHPMQTQFVEPSSQMNSVWGIVVALILALAVRHAQTDSGTSPQKYALTKSHQILLQHTHQHQVSVISHTTCSCPDM